MVPGLETLKPKKAPRVWVVTVNVLTRAWWKTTVRVEASTIAVAAAKGSREGLKAFRRDRVTRKINELLVKVVALKPLPNGDS